MTRAIYLPAAEKDIVAAHASYEGRSAGLGDQFAQAVSSLVERVSLACRRCTRRWEREFVLLRCGGSRT